MSYRVDNTLDIGCAEFVVFADLFISLIRGGDFPIEFMAKCSRARFKIGRQQLPGDTFDMVVSEPEDKVFSQEEVFSGIRDYLKFIEK